MSGVEGVRILKERYSKLLMLMNTVYDDDERIFQALCAGASGYLLKKTPPARLLESLNEAIDGGAPMSPEVARRVLNLFRQVRPPEHGDYKLTPHELRLLKLLVEGHSYKTAAAKLGVTAKTISFHLQKIHEKLQLPSPKLWPKRFATGWSNFAGYELPNKGYKSELRPSPSYLESKSEEQ